MFIAAVLVCALSSAALLVAESRGSRSGVWVFKPLAAAAFIAAAVAADATATTYGAWILTGLVLSMGGDVALIPKESPAAFLAGISSFLLGHVAYAVAFASVGVSVPAAAVTAVVMTAFSVAVLRWLLTHLEGPFRIAVPVYTAVIGTMVVLAVGMSVAGGWTLPAVGAVLFAVSDVSVARDRFVEETTTNKYWGLPMYFGGQLVLAASILEVAA